MAILNYYHLSVTSAAISPDSSSSSSQQPIPDQRLRKIILPKKNPEKWSTGLAPGDYGGPPTTTKLRIYWGADVDPLESDDFMWNKEFMDRMSKLIQDPTDTSAELTSAKEKPSGFLSLNRVMSLESLEVDLSKELTASPAKPELKQQHVEEATTQSLKSTAVKWRHAPTRREQDKWDRATKAATGGSEVMFRELRRSKEDPKVVAEQYRKQYFKLKKRLQVLTLGIVGVGLVSAYVSYSPEIAARASEMVIEGVHCILWRRVYQRRRIYQWKHVLVWWGKRVMHVGILIGERCTYISETKKVVRCICNHTVKLIQIGSICLNQSSLE